MEAIRRILTVKNNVLNIILPDNYKDKKVELIIFPVEEEIMKAKIDYDQFYGSLKSGLSIDEIDLQLKTIRNEWERDIS